MSIFTFLSKNDIVIRTIKSEWVEGKNNTFMKLEHDPGGLRPNYQGITSWHSPSHYRKLEHRNENPYTTVNINDGELLFRSVKKLKIGDVLHVSSNCGFREVTCNGEKCNDDSFQDMLVILGWTTCTTAIVTIAAILIN